MPNIDVFVTTILSNPAMRGRHERVERALMSARVPFTKHDVASDSEAKAYWKRKCGTNTELPAVLVNGERVGSVEQLDEAVEFGELRQFLRLDEPADSTSSASASTSLPPTSQTPSTSDDTSKSTSKTDEDLLASLDKLELTDEELASLNAELAQDKAESSKGYVPTQGRGDHSFTYTPTAPLSFGGKKGTVTGSGKDRVETIRPGGDRPIGSGDLNDIFDGIELTEEEANALAKYLGFDEEGQGHGAGDHAGLLGDLQSSGGKAPATTATEAEDDDRNDQFHSPSMSSVYASASSTPAAVWDPDAERDAVTGAGGAELSGSLNDVDSLKLSPAAVKELKREVEELGPVIEVDPPVKIEDIPPAPPSKFEDEERELPKPPGTSKKEALELKTVLGNEKAERETELPVAREVHEALTNEEVLAATK